MKYGIVKSLNKLATLAELNSIRSEAYDIYMQGGESGAYTVVPGLYGWGTDSRMAYQKYEETGDPADLPKVLHVDTLADGTSSTDDTHGSLIWALTRDFPRIVVFDVGGVFHMHRDDDSWVCYVQNPYLWVAGQTAPSIPVILTKTGITFRSSGHTLMQHIALRGRGQGQED